MWKNRLKGTYRQRMDLIFETIIKWLQNICKKSAVSFHYPCRFSYRVNIAVRYCSAFAKQYLSQ